jgi:hypothetical protein
MLLKFGTLYVRSLCRSSSLKTGANKLAMNNLGLVAMQEVGWVDNGNQPADDYTLFFFGNGHGNDHLGTGFFIHKVIISAFKKVEFIDDRMSYITLRGHWCDNYCSEHACTKDKNNDTKYSFYKELGCVFSQFLKYYMKILLDFITKVGSKDIFKHEELGMRVYMKLVITVATSENIIVKSTMFPCCNIHKCSWTSGHLLIEKTTKFITS